MKNCFYKEGDKSKGICQNCGLMNTTFKLKDVKISDTELVCASLLVACCDKCNEVVGVPQQSVSTIKETLENNNEKK